MSGPTCSGSIDTREPGVDVRTLLLILDNPKEDRFPDAEYRLEDPRKLNSFKDAGWTAIDISDSNELPLDNWGSVEVKHHIPFNNISTAEFMKKFNAIFGDFRDCNRIKVIIISANPDYFLKALQPIALLNFIDIKVLITDKRRIKTPLN